MSTTWIRDKVVAVAEAQAEETGEDASEIIWQLSKELGHMAQVSGPQPVIANIDADAVGMADVSEHVERIKKSLDNLDASKIAPAFDSVSRPAHYTEGRKHEPKDVIRDWGLNHNLGEAVKYLSRAGRKNDIIEDLEKAITCIGFEVAALKEERDGSQD